MILTFSTSKTIRSADASAMCIRKMAVPISVQKVDRLHLTRMEECHEEIAHDTDILNVKNDPVGRCFRNVHSEDGRADLGPESRSTASHQDGRVSRRDSA